MAENKLSYSDLFDFTNESEINRALKALDNIEANYAKLTSAIIGDSKRIADAQARAFVGLKDSERLLKSVSVTNESGRKSASELAKGVEEAVRAYVGLKGAAKGAEETQKLFANSLTEGRTKLASLRKELAGLDKDANPAQIKALALEIQQTRVQFEGLERASRGVANEFTAAKGSYDALVAENRKLTTELKALGNVFDATGNKSAELVAKEAALKNQIATNTAALTKYDAELNQYYRNVGNYASALQSSVAALNRNKAALEGQLQALRQQAAANKQNIELQNKLQSEIRQTEASLATTNKQLSSYGVGVKTASQNTEAFVGGVRRVGAELLGAYVGLQALSNIAQGTVAANYQIADSLADVRKATGLTEQGVNNLADGFRKIDTRTALNDLLAISTVGGQLGVSAVNIDEFTESIDKASVALGDEFTGGAEEVATAIAKIDNIFKTSKTVGIDKAYLGIASAINQLGADGAATGPFIADFVTRVGAVTKNMNIGLPKVLGYAAAMEELGLRSESSSTALNQVLSKMSSAPQAYFSIAKLANANLTFKEFSDILNKDASQALNLFLKGLNAGGGTTTEFNTILSDLKLKGSEARTVLTTLAKNTELVEERQKTATKQLQAGTSVLEEYNIKNNNLAGSLDKIKNQFVNVATSGAVQNFLKGAADNTLTLIAVLKTVATALFQNRDILLAMALAFAGYRSASVLAVIAEKGFAGALGITRISILRNIVALKAMWASMLANPVGLVLVAITALVVGFNRLEESSERNTQLAEKMARLNKTLTSSQEEVSKAQEAINAKLQEFEKLSPKQQELVLKEIRANKARALSLLEVAQAQQKVALNKAVETNAFDQIKAVALSGGNPAAMATLIAKGQQERVQSVLDSSKDGIKQLKEQIKDFDKQIAEATNKQETSRLQASQKAKAEDDEAKKRRLKEQKDALALLAYQREQLAKSLEAEAELRREYADKQYKLFEDGKITTQQYAERVAETEDFITAAMRRASGYRIQAAKAQTDSLLLDEELTKSGRLKILEEYAASVTEIEARVQKALALEPLELSVVGVQTRDTRLENKIGTNTTRLEDSLLTPEDAAKKYGNVYTGIEDVLKSFYDRDTDAFNQRLKDQEDAWKESQKRKTEELKRAEEERVAIQQAAQDLATAAIDAGFQFFADNQAAKLQNLQAQTNNELAIAGDNEAAKVRIQNEADRKAAKIKKKQAIAEKAQALFSIALQTAIGVAKAVAESPITFGLPWSAFALANGAIQAALVLARPIPAYAKGVKNAPAGPALVGEAGQELLVTPSGKAQLTTGPTIVNMQKGTTVYNSKETLRIKDAIAAAENRSLTQNLAASYTTSERMVSQTQQSLNATELTRLLGAQIGGYFERLAKDFKTRPMANLSFDKRGFVAYLKSEARKDEILNNFYERTL